MNKANLDSLRPDISAGFSVALVALPLSIGIALASGAPASAGLIAAIIGGLIGSFLGGTTLTINGPAAGLIVIVLDAIMEIGGGDLQHGFRGMLAAAIVAGGIQVIFGALKLGSKSSIFPTSVIHGMMAAIGLIILAKQVHVLMGYAPVAKNPVMLYAEIPHALMNMQPLVFLVGMASLGILILMTKMKAAWTKIVPAPLLAVIAGSIIALLIGIPDKALLTIPSNVSAWIITPDFSVLSTFAGWKAAITLALVASLETVLSAAAVDKIDPLKRKSDLDRDLLSKGICNMASAAIGGLPMIAEIVRSSANISYGAKSKFSNFFHGLFILLAVLLLPRALAYIPLAALAAVLIMVGSRLGNPTHLLHAKKVGIDNLIGFTVTLIMTLAVDLLVGIFLGFLAQFIVEMILGLRFSESLKPSYLEMKNESNIMIEVHSSLTFSNFLSLKQRLQHLSDGGKNVSLNVERCPYIDNSVVEQVEELKESFSRKNLSLEMILSDHHRPLGNDRFSAVRRGVA